MDRKEFRNTFEARAIVVADVPAGAARDLAGKVNRPAGPADATLRTRAEYDALFDAIRQEAGTDEDAQPGEPMLQLVDEHGERTVAGRLVDIYRDASIGKKE